jgi:hypothetical protein
MDFPIGKRVVMDAHGVVEELPADHPVQYWICYRLDEPWTWKPLSNQFTGHCATCHAGIIYRVSALNPTNPGVQKICRRCAERLLEADGDEGTAVRADG